MILPGNLFSHLPDDSAHEHFQDLLRLPGVRVERIVSHGQITPVGEWYDQSWDEWVLVLKGAARIRLESEKDEIPLGEGDHLYLPAHCRHRVEWTSPGEPTIWLAIHLSENTEGGGNG